jgi:hypothetical protein
VSGDGLVAPLNAPAAGAIATGVQPGTTQPVVIANLVIIFGPAGKISGLFVYQPGTVPGAGNPPIAWITAASADPYGNTVQPGMFLAELAASGNARAGLLWNTIVGSEPLLALFPDATVGFTGNSPFALGRVFNRGLASELVSLALGGGGTAGTGSPVQVEAFSQSKDGTVLGHVSFYDWASTDLICDINAAGITAANPAVSNANETWHAMTLLNSWANVAGFATARYRKTALNQVEIIGAVNAAAATTATFATLPAGYQPASQQPACAMGANASVPAGLSPWIRCDTSGNLTVQNTGALGAWEAFFHGFIALDA